VNGWLFLDLELGPLNSAALGRAGRQFKTRRPPTSLTTTPHLSPRTSSLTVTCSASSIHYSTCIRLRESTLISAPDFDVPASWVSWPGEDGKETTGHKLLVVSDRDCRPFETSRRHESPPEMLYTKVVPQQYVVGPIFASRPGTVVLRTPPSDGTNDVTAGPRGVGF
jgi:hypothetical protein